MKDGLALDPIGDLGDLRLVLRAAHLPEDDLAAAPARGWRQFWAARDAGGRVLGYGGLEGWEKTALLRSVVILPPYRGLGHGRRLIAGILAEARKRDLAEIWLLTQDAADFFASLGFRDRPREAAPPEIAAAPQFRSLCPASARLLSLAFATASRSLS